MTNAHKVRKISEMNRAFRVRPCSFLVLISSHRAPTPRSAVIASSPNAIKSFRDVTAPFSFVFLLAITRWQKFDRRGRKDRQAFVVKYLLVQRAANRLVPPWPIYQEPPGLVYRSTFGLALQLKFEIGACHLWIIDRVRKHEVVSKICGTHCLDHREVPRKPNERDLEGSMLDAFRLHFIHPEEMRTVTAHA